VRRQLSSVEKGGEVWEQCVKIVREEAEVLIEVGVDFSGMVVRGLENGDGGSEKVVAKPESAATGLGL
jgi:hypothetical protein